MLGCALLAAPFLASFSYSEREDLRFTPQSTSLGYWLLGPLTIIYVLANAFVLVLSFFPADANPGHTAGMPTLPYYTGPVAGGAVIAFGILWWTWDRHLLPAFGYYFSTQEEHNYSPHWRIDILQVRFHVSPTKAFSIRVRELTKRRERWMDRRDGCSGNSSL